MSCESFAEREHKRHADEMRALETPHKPRFTTDSLNRTESETPLENGPNQLSKQRVCTRAATSDSRT
jgi:hypothetical protein